MTGCGGAQLSAPASGEHKQEEYSPGQPGHLKNNQGQRAGGMAQVVAYLPNIHKVLSLVPGTAKREKERKREEREKEREREKKKN
jgi:hypothetical protein